MLRNKLSEKFERIAHEEISQIWLLVRPIIADQFDIRVTVDDISTLCTTHLARPFPVDDHGRTAGVEFLVF